MSKWLPRMPAYGCIGELDCVSFVRDTLTIKVEATRAFTDWLDNLKDLRGRAIIQARIERFAAGNPGHHKDAKGGVSELRIKFGPGYRVYYTRRGKRLILLLCGGDKASQNSDFRTARQMVRDLED
ncbi:MAG: type II toxin-antitoxin system RelE/ParE family toxin [Nitrosospira sp.]|nr:type II toxin-antitoxin system RelE/ParE family toxin [Nitrosospira sp.]